LQGKLSIAFPALGTGWVYKSIYQMKPTNMIKNWRKYASFVYTFLDLSGILSTVHNVIDG